MGLSGLLPTRRGDNPYLQHIHFTTKIKGIALGFVPRLPHGDPRKPGPP
jgi:hypothetical protein